MAPNIYEVRKVYEKLEKNKLFFEFIALSLFGREL